MDLESKLDVEVPSVAADQLDEEQSAVLEIWKARWRRALEVGVEHSMNQQKAMFATNRCTKFSSGHTYPILASVGNEALVDIMMHEIECISGEPSPHNCEARRVERVGYNILSAYNVARMRQAGRDDLVRRAHSHYCELLALKGDEPVVPRVLYEQLFKSVYHNGEYLEMNKPILSVGLLNSIGRFVYSVIKQYLNISLPLSQHKLADIPLVRQETITIGFK